MKRAILLLIVLAAFLYGATPAQPVPPPGGPIVLVGIDAEDGGPGGHGPIGNYVTLVNDILGDATKGSNILVVGGGKGPSDSVTTWWNAIDSGVASATVTYVNGAANISAADFTPYKLVAVVSDQFNTPSGGLTAAEDTAIDGRSSDLAGHVNAGGGVLGFSSAALPNPYGYIATLAPVTTAQPPQYDNIDPTAEGTAVGITDALDICCWHDVFTSFPSFFSVLAFQAGTTDAAAIGGQNVVVPTMEITPLTAENETGTEHCVTVTLEDQDGNPLPGETIIFTVSGANTAGGADITDANGQAMFCYTGTNAGDDDIEAFADLNHNGIQEGNEPFALAEKTWIVVNQPPDCSSLAINGPSMWPPNHKMRSFTVSGGTDPDLDPLTISITSVFQDEPVNGTGDGDTSPDAIITSANTVDLRGERSGNLNGRVYYVGVTLSDNMGGSCSSTLTVGVPHDQGPKGGPVGEGPLYNSTVA